MGMLSIHLKPLEINCCHEIQHCRLIWQFKTFDVTVESKMKSFCSIGHLDYGFFITEKLLLFYPRVWHLTVLTGRCQVAAADQMGKTTVFINLSNLHFAFDFFYYTLYIVHFHLWFPPLVNAIAISFINPFAGVWLIWLLKIKDKLFSSLNWMIG